MRSKKMLMVSLLLFTLLFVVALPTTAATGKYKIDGGHSSVFFKIKHLDVAYFFGRFNEMEGHFHFDQEKPEASTLEIKIKAGSVDSNSEKRDAHLKSPDFFNANEYPEITLKSVHFEKTQEKDLYLLKGELTLLNTTKTIESTVRFTGSRRNECTLWLSRRFFGYL
jgi:polyisoprenoid-binding protein YceI